MIYKQTIVSGKWLKENIVIADHLREVEVSMRLNWWK